MIVLLEDRYGGAYSRAKWTAWRMDPQDIPLDVVGGDTECAEFWGWRRRTSPAEWEKYRRLLGFGETPQDAIADLERKEEQ